MKRVNGAVPSFTPFTLVIETADEARLLAVLLGNVPVSIERKIGVNSLPAYEMYAALEDFNPKDDRVNIQITVK